MSDSLHIKCGRGRWCVTYFSWSCRWRIDIQVQCGKLVADVVHAICPGLLAYLLQSVFQSPLPTTPLASSFRSGSRSGEEIKGPLGLWRRVERCKDAEAIC